MKRTVVCLIGGMIGVVQCFFCMAEEAAAERGTGLWGFNEESCKTIRGQIKNTRNSDIKKLCDQSSEELATDIAIMQVILLGKHLERQLQQKNVVLDISPDKIIRLAQTMYLSGDSVNESAYEKGVKDGTNWHNETDKFDKFDKGLGIWLYGIFICPVFDKSSYLLGVSIGADPEEFPGSPY